LAALLRSLAAAYYFNHRARSNHVCTLGDKLILAGTRETATLRRQSPLSPPPPPGRPAERRPCRHRLAVARSVGRAGDPRAAAAGADQRSYRRLQQSTSVKDTFIRRDTRTAAPAPRALGAFSKSYLSGSVLMEAH